MSADVSDFVIHVGHEVKMLAFAVARFRLAVEALVAADGRPLCDRANLPATHFIIPFQDSALARGRTLLDFLTQYGDERNLYIRDFYVPSGAKHPTTTPPYQKWMAFINDRLLHVGRRRMAGDPWPDRPSDLPSDAEDVGRLDRLWGCIFELINNRVDHAPLAEQAREVTELIVLRATDYLDLSGSWNRVHDNEAAFHAMDPHNILMSLGLA